MRTFTDGRGCTWEIRLDIGALERCAAAGIHLDEVLSGKSDLLIKLRYDAPLVARTLAAICRPEFSKCGVQNDQEFIERLDAGTLGEAKALLRDELVDFFSQFDPAAGRPLRLWLERDRELAELVGANLPIPPESSGASSGVVPASAA